MHAADSASNSAESPRAVARVDSGSRSARRYSIAPNAATTRVSTPIVTSAFVLTVLIELTVFISTANTPITDANESAATATLSGSKSESAINAAANKPIATVSVIIVV